MALIFFAAFSLILKAFASETHHQILSRRRRADMGLIEDMRLLHRPSPKEFMTVSLFRPIHMLFTEPITTFIAIHTACSFATLFTFFTSFPHVFSLKYHFSIENQGLVFAAIIVGNLLALPTIILFDIFLYQRQIKRYSPEHIPPENRLYAAMLGAIGLLVSLFWFAWSADKGISWASPAIATVFFAWWNLCVLCQQPHT